MELANMVRGAALECDGGAIRSARILSPSTHRGPVPLGLARRLRTGRYVCFGWSAPLVDRHGSAREHPLHIPNYGGVFTLRPQRTVRRQPCTPMPSQPPFD